MTTHHRRVSGLTWLIVFLIFSSSRTAHAETAAINLGKIKYTRVVPGLDYANVRDTNLPLSVHIARLERGRKDLQIVTSLGQGRIHGLASLSRQVAAFPRALGTPLAAINGDFFEIRPGPYQGDPESLQVINGEVVSGPNDKAFWIDPEGEPHLEKAYSRFEIIWPDQSRSRFGLNQAPRPHSITLFTPVFGDSTHATNLTEMVLEPATGIYWPPLRLAETYRVRVRETRPAGNTSLDSNRWVLTLTDSAITNLSRLKPDDTITLSTATVANMPNPTSAIGGGPILLRDGVAQPWPARKTLTDYLQPRHPRTAVGFNQRHIYFVAVDGRQRGLSAGVSFVELTSLLQQLGCTDAMNLDGGGSTTFWLNDKVVNSPSDGRERSIANALLIVQRPK